MFSKENILNWKFSLEHLFICCRFIVIPRIQTEIGNRSGRKGKRDLQVLRAKKNVS